jgi:hypothetical protein
MLPNAEKVVELTMAAVYYGRGILLDADGWLGRIWPGDFDKEFMEML